MRCAPRSRPKLWSISSSYLPAGYLLVNSSLVKIWNPVMAVTSTGDWEHSLLRLQSLILIPMSTHCTNICGLFMKHINGGVTMAKDTRDILKVLKFELDFVESGGYGRSVRSPWLPTSIFQDSLTCLNFGDPERSHPCSECLLMEFVPPERHSAGVPCHYIPLDDLGETVHSLERWETQEEMEYVLKTWLRTTIKRLEKERALQPSPQTTEAICCLRDAPKV